MDLRVFLFCVFLCIVDCGNTLNCKVACIHKSMLHDFSYLSVVCVWKLGKGYDLPDPGGNLCILVGRSIVHVVNICQFSNKDYVHGRLLIKHFLTDVILFANKRFS